MWSFKTNFSYGVDMFTILGFMKKPYFVIFISVFLCGCGSNPMVWTGKDFSVLKEVDEPSIGVVTTKNLGDAVVRKGTFAQVESIKIRGEQVLFPPRKGYPPFKVDGNQEGELDGMMTFKGGETWSCYSVSGHNEGNIWNTVAKQWPLKLCQGGSSDGVFDKEMTGQQYMACHYWAGWPICFPSTIASSKTIKPSSTIDTYAQELIYNGRVDNYLKFIYREFINDYARAAFTQDIQYDIQQSKIIGFKNVKIKILDATNTELVYEVISNF